MLELRQQILCFVCHSADHLAKNCPKMDNQEFAMSKDVTDSDLSVPDNDKTVYQSFHKAFSLRRLQRMHRRKHKVMMHTSHH
jgi:hypothetical protein